MEALDNILSRTLSIGLFWWCVSSSSTLTLPARHVFIEVDEISPIKPPSSCRYLGRCKENRNSQDIYSLLARFFGSRIQGIRPCYNLKAGMESTDGLVAVR